MHVNNISHYIYKREKTFYIRLRKLDLNHIIIYEELRFNIILFLLSNHSQ